MAWFKGSLHTHSTNSDGDASPAELVEVYAALGYDFLYITDHVLVTSVEEFKNEDILVMTGTEIGIGIADGRWAEVNALGIPYSFKNPTAKATMSETLQTISETVSDCGAISQINHPNIGWNLNSSDITPTKGIKLIEVSNCYPNNNNLGGGDKPSTDELWDQLLSAGMKIFGTATDDCHTIHCPNWADYQNLALPGKGWVVVRADKKTPEAIQQALINGDFYSSTGIILDEIEVTDTEYSLRIQCHFGSLFTTLFLGQDGQLLKIDTSLTPSYSFDGTETYVRAKIFESCGRKAWVQPVWRK